MNLITKFEVKIEMIWEGANITDPTPTPLSTTLTHMHAHTHTHTLVSSPPQRPLGTPLTANVMSVQAFCCSLLLLKFKFIYFSIIEIQVMTTYQKSL